MCTKAVCANISNFSNGWILSRNCHLNNKQKDESISNLPGGWGCSSQDKNNAVRCSLHGLDTFRWCKFRPNDVCCSAHLHFRIPDDALYQRTAEPCLRIPRATDGSTHLNTTRCPPLAASHAHPSHGQPCCGFAHGVPHCIMLRFIPVQQRS